MSVLCRLSVYKCDLCDVTFSVRNEDDAFQFAKNWDVGRSFHFCPEHKHTPEALSRIADRINNTRHTIYREKTNVL